MEKCDEMIDFEVKTLQKDEYTLWDELVEQSPHGTIFHNSNWLTTCGKLLNKNLKIYGCFKNEELVGGCSLYAYKMGFFNISSSNLKMTPYGGVVVAELKSSKVREQERTYSNIIKSLCNAFDKEHFGYIRLDNTPDLVDIRPFIWNGWESKIQYTYYFNLKSDIEKSISKKVRNTMRKAIKNDITIKKLNDPSTFYDLFSMTFKRQNLTPSVTKEFFEGIVELLKSRNTGEMWIAQAPTGEMASAEIIIWDNKRAYRWSAASHTEFKDSGATSLLLCEVFKNLKNRGFNEINLMAANTPHLAKFVSSFNPSIVPYFSVLKKTGLAKIAMKIYNRA